MKHSAGRDLDAFRAFAAGIEARARGATDGSADAAYAWLANNNRALISEMGAFTPGFLDFGSALLFATQCFYWEAVASPMDPSLLEHYSSDYRDRAFSEGRDEKAGLQWLSANMATITQENVALYPDWKERNTAYGELQKRLFLKLHFHSPIEESQNTEPPPSLPGPASGQAALAAAVQTAVGKWPGSTDREITDQVVGSGAPQQRVNGICRALAAKGAIVRRKRADGLIGNFPPGVFPSAPESPAKRTPPDGETAIDMLSRLGFQLAGHWRIRAGRPSFELQKHGQSRDVLYAFVTRTNVMYVGKTTMPVVKRMTGYSKPGPTQPTNKRVRAKIAELLSGGGTLDIWVMLSEPLTFRGFDVSLAAGLEDAVVEAISPAWNLLGRGRRRM